MLSVKRSLNNFRALKGLSPFTSSRILRLFGVWCSSDNRSLNNLPGLWKVYLPSPVLGYWDYLESDAPGITEAWTNSLAEPVDKTECQWPRSIWAATWENRIFAYAKTKTQISFAVTNQRLIFATRIVQSFFFLNTKFQASSHLLWLYSLVCVRPGLKPWRPVFSQRGSYHKRHVVRTGLLGIPFGMVQDSLLGCQS